MQKLALDYYDASDGPRIVLFGSLDGPFNALQALFKRLIQSDQPIEFQNEPFIQSSAGVQIVASRCKRSSTSQGVAHCTTDHGEKFQWSLTSEDWDDVSELMDSLIRSPTSCHQYLSRHTHDDAIVVVSKGEYE
jgi:hypothetical protein